MIKSISTSKEIANPTLIRLSEEDQNVPTIGKGKRASSKLC